MAYRDDATNRGLPRHETVRRSIAEYVNGMAHLNGLDSFWAGLKRGHRCTFHYVLPDHLHRHINEFAGRHRRRTLDPQDMMAKSVRAMVGKHLLHAKLVAA